jgi:hypothetical protein
MRKTANIITVAVFVFIIAFLSVAFLVVEDKAFSEQENRNLQTLPELNADTLFDGTYNKKINTYFADQFPFRDTFVGLKGLSEYAMLKGENNGVLLGDDGYLAVRAFSIYDGKKFTDPTDYYSEKVLDAEFAAVKKLQSTLDAQGKKFAMIAPPRTIDVASSKFSFPSENSEKLQNYIRNGFKDVNYIDILPMLKEKLDNGEYVYYKTDHHFTSLGAYYTYCEVMKQFGMEKDIIPLDKFTQELASDSFFGTTWSKSGFKFVGADSIYYFHCKDVNEDEFTTTKYLSEEKKETFTGFYDRSLLNSKDKYSSFLGGNSYKTTVTKTSGEQRPKLLLAKDSFALSLAPFLALHFDLELVNVSDMQSVSKLAESSGCNYVLVIYNAENLITSKYLAYIS